MIKRLLATGLVVGALAAAVPATSASAYNLLGCKFAGSGNALKWQDVTRSSGYASAGASAVSAWNSTSTQFNMAKVSSGANIRVADGNYGATWMGASFVGITLDSHQANPITNSCSGGTWDTTIVTWWNTHYTDSFTATKRKAIMVHELGHALGLAHTSGSGCSVGIMDVNINTKYDECGGFSTPRQDDINGANALY